MIIFTNSLLMKSGNGLKDYHLISGMHSLKIKEECQVVITEQFGKYLIMKAKNWEESFYHLNLFGKSLVRRRLWII